MRARQRIVLALALALGAAGQTTHGGALSAVAPTGASAQVPVNITGTGFDADASNNRVTFHPLSGSAVSAVATRVVTVDAARGIRRITVTVPDLPLGPTGLRVTNLASGEQSEGQSLDVIAIALPELRTGARGAANLRVRITGSPLAKFVAGVTRAAFGAGVTVNATTVESAVSLVADISIPASAALGSRQVSVITPQQTATVSGAFTVTDPAPVNKAPVVDAGTGQTITLPAQAELTGSVTDDGLPAGAPLTRAWSKFSGPGTVTFGAASDPATTATFSQAGTYVLRLTASDTAFSPFDDVTIEVNPPAPVNQAPVVDAGTGQTITLPAVAQLNGSVTDDGLPAGAALTRTWVKLSGPGEATFGNSSAASTSVSFSEAGQYLLRLIASDTVHTTQDEVMVFVDPAPRTNQAPVVSAGEDRTVTLPAQAALAATVTDDALPEGAGLAFEWIKVSGPGTVTFGSPSAASTTAAFGQSGIYVLRVTASDSALSGADEVGVTVNLRPTIDVGAARTITLPDQVSLAGAVTDDGLPDGAPLSLEWTKVSGPGTVTFSTPAAASSSASFSREGEYVLRLFASDSASSAHDDVGITVNPAPRPNTAPVVSAGADRAITLPEQASLEGNVTDDGSPAGSALTISWTRVSGPGVVTFGTANAAATSAAFAAPGNYVLRLSASDSALGAHDDVAVTVNPPVPANAAPTVGAGADRTVTLPDTASLVGTVNDDGLPAGAAISVEWTKVSGPGSVTFGAPGSASTSAAFGAPGDYVLRLRATDTALSGEDEVAVRVDPIPQAPVPPANRAPVASAGGPYAGEIGAPVAFDGRLSSDPDRDPLSFSWSFGDDATGRGAAPVHAYVRGGTFTATLTIDDGRGGTSSAAASVTIAPPSDRAPPVVSLNVPSEVLPGTSARVTAQAIDNVGVASLTFAVDSGAPSPAEPPYRTLVPIPAVAAPGSRITVRARATDAAGNAGSAEAVMTVGSVPDVTPPVVTLAAPPTAAPGSSVRLVASAHDDTGVASVALLVGPATIATREGAPFDATYTVPSDAVVGSALLARARAADHAGNTAQAEASIQVVAAPDTTPPSIALTAPPVALPGSRVKLAATAEDNVGIAAVAFFVAGVRVAVDADAPYETLFDLPAAMGAGSLVFVEARATDLSALEATATGRIRIAAPGRGVLSGEVYDDASGLPVAGATVTLSREGTQGETTPTDERGRYAFRANAGEHWIRIAKSGWTTVDRDVTAAEGVSVDAFDARLTPLVQVAAPISSVLGGQREVPGGFELLLAPGALAADAPLVVTPIGPQGLQGLLPPGWTPVAAVDISPAGIPFAGAVLRVPNALGIAGRALTIARWDAAARGWRVVSAVTAPQDGGSFSYDPAVSGQYIWVAADAVPHAPPQPALDAMLAGVEASLIPPAASSVVDPEPQIAFYRPDVKSDVRATVSTAAPLPSGTAILARIRETYSFESGSTHPEPMVQDFMLYQSSASGTALSATFVVTASETFDPLTFHGGTINVELRAPVAVERTGALVGADGGLVAAPTGETLVVPPGAAAEPVAVDVRRLTAAELGFALPAGLNYVGAVSIVVSHGPLTSPAAVSVPRPLSLVDESRVLLARVEPMPGGTRLVLVGIGRIAGERVLGDPIVPGAGVPFEGVLRSGRYVFVRTDAEVGFASGRVLGPDGQPFTGAVVTSGTLPLAARSRAGGQYLTAAASGPATLTALDPAKRDTGSAAVTIQATPVSADLRLETTRPRVISVSPADGAQNVSVGLPIVITFSEAIDPASVSGAHASRVTLASGGTPAAGAVTLSGNGAALTFRPNEPLVPDAAYTLTLDPAIADLSGTTLGAPYTSRFTSRDTSAPPPPPAGTVTATVPNGAGLTTVAAAQGTAAAHDTVTIVNVSENTFTPVLLESNGGFVVTLAAARTDRLVLRIVDPAGNETAVPLPRFSQANPDGSISTVVDADGGRVSGPDGVALDVPPGALPDGTVVTIRPVPLPTFPVQLTPAQREIFELSRAFALDFGGAVPAADLQASIAASGGETAQDRWVVGALDTIGGRAVLTVADTARLIGDRIATASPPCRGVDTAQTYAFIKSRRPLRLVYGRFVSDEGAVPSLVEVAQPSAQGDASIPLPYAVVETPPEASDLQCIPVFTGPVTIEPNAPRIAVAASQLTAADRELVVVNNTTGEQRRYPRAVADHKFVVPGAPTDRFEVIVSGAGGEQAPPFEVDATSPTHVTVRVDMDRVNASSSAVVIRNLTRQPAASVSFPVSAAAVRLHASGAAGDGYQVSAVAENGAVRSVAFSVEPPTGGENLIARALTGSIEPNADVFLIDSSDGVLDAADPRTQIPESAMAGGGFTYAFTGNPAHLYGIEVRARPPAPEPDAAGPWAALVDQQHRPGDIATIPQVLISITGGVSGPSRTVVVQVPPLDEPAYHIATSSNDRTPPSLIQSPPLLGNLTPSEPLSFIFSESISRNTLVGAQLQDASGGIVDAEVRLSDRNRILTFVPKSPLSLGTEYAVVFDGLRDGSGNRMKLVRLAIKTFEPLPIVPPFANPQVAFVRDVLLFRSDQTGLSHMLTIASLPQPRESIGNTIISFNTSDARNPVRQTGFASDGIPSHGAALHGVKNIVLDRDTPCPLTTTNAKVFSGDLAFVVRTFYKSATVQSHTNSMLIYDMTSPAQPCQLGVKIFGQVTTDRKLPLVYPEAGDALGVAALRVGGRAIAYAAVTKLGLVMADLRKNVGAADTNQVSETRIAGDYLDVAALGDRVAAIHRDDNDHGTIQTFSPDLAPGPSDPFGGAAHRLVFGAGMLVDANNDGEITNNERRDLLFAGGHNAVKVYDVTGGLLQPLARIPVPGTIYELAVDLERRQIFAGGARASGDWGIFQIDLSGPKPFLAPPASSSGLDGRIVWQSPLGKYSLGGPVRRALRFDDYRRLLYVTSDTGLDTYYLELNLRGRATYTFFPATARDPFSHKSKGIDYTKMEKRPIRRARVELRSHLDGLLDTTYTDDTGHYAFWVQPNTAVQAVVKAALGPGAEPVLIVDNHQGMKLHEKASGLFTMPASKTLDVHAETQWLGTHYGKHEAGPFAILDSVSLAYRKLAEIAPDLNVAAAPLKIRWSRDNVCDQQTVADVWQWKHFDNKVESPFRDTLYLCGKEGQDTDEYDRQVILHEWSHYFQHLFSQPMTLGLKHLSGDILDPRVAFQEGFATAFAALLGEDNVYVDTNGPRQSGVILDDDVETDNLNWGGFFSEDSVEEVIYDLFDAAPPNVVTPTEHDEESGIAIPEDLHLDLKHFTNALASLKSSRAFATIHTFLVHVARSVASDPGAAGLHAKMVALAKAENIEMTPAAGADGPFDEFQQAKVDTIRRPALLVDGIPIGPFYTPVPHDGTPLPATGATEISRFGPNTIFKGQPLKTSLDFDTFGIGNKLYGPVYLVFSVPSGADGRYRLTFTPPPFDKVNPGNNNALEVYVVHGDGRVLHQGTNVTLQGLPVSIEANFSVGKHAVVVQSWHNAFDKWNSAMTTFTVKIEKP